MKVPGYSGWFIQHKIKGRKYWYYHSWDPSTKKQTSKRMDPANEYLEQAGTNGEEVHTVTPNLIDTEILKILIPVFARAHIEVELPFEYQERIKELAKDVI